MKPSTFNTRTLRGGLAGLLAGASLTVLALGAPSHAFDPQPAPMSAPAPVLTALPQTSSNLADMVERVSPSVVQIMVRQASPMQRVAAPGDFDDLPPELRDFFGPNFRFFFGDQPNFPRQTPDRVGSGSGFFIEGGYIVTNNHVVDNAKKLRVRFDTGEEVEGTLVGTDAKTDLAVIKVDAKHARKPLAWGDSSRSRAGDNVFTIGAPFALGNTVTAGIISARGRDISSGPYDDYFQIDAPINPGNSGGPMFNAAGEVIGVNTAIYSPSGGNVGIGFSIPAEQARAVVRQIIDRGYVERGWLGVNIQRVTPEIAQSLGESEAKGALIAEVTPDSPAAKAGLEALDLITSYGGRPIANMHDLTRAVADTRPGETREVKIRRDGRERAINVRIEALEKPSKAKASAVPSEGKVSLAGDLGLEVAEDAKGLVITAVSPDSPAREAGLRVGDRLLAVGDAKIKSVQEAQNAVRDTRSKGRTAVLVQIERDGAKLFLGVPLTNP
jgi:serine protease Do